jgi:predicted MFS family arabinose efflux permease
MQQQLVRAGQTLRRTLARYAAVFAERNVALLLGAGFASEIGDWFNTIALISLSFRFGEGALGVGGMLAVRMVTRLLLQGPAGTLVDRHQGRRLLIASQLLMAVIASAFAVLVIIPDLWLLFLLVILLEGTNCVARPAFMVELKAVAPEDQRAAANGALFASMTTAQLVGPLLGALVLAPFGAGMVFALNGATFLGVAAAVARLRGGLHDAANGETHQIQPVQPPIATAPPVSSGYSWLLRRQDLGLYALGCLSLSLLTQATIALFVVRSNALGLGDGGVGVFFAAVALGSIAGSIVAGARAAPAAPLYPAAVAMGLCALALAAFGVVGTVALALMALVVVGFATDYYEVVGLTYFQHSIPDVVYGRFFSLFLIALSAGGLVGALAGPSLEQSLGVEVSLVALAAPGVALALILAFLSRSWGNFETPRIARE